MNVTRSLFGARFCLLFSFAPFAQSACGTITGAIADPAGAVVANAPIQAKTWAPELCMTSPARPPGTTRWPNLPAGQPDAEFSGRPEYRRESVPNVPLFTQDINCHCFDPARRLY
ncbi:MAG TPA: hypothetical protein VN841_28060 [Bryobacteraceae bacterium]|nr:hypothetical protein [Bryobacteraceae bacterium]